MGDDRGIGRDSSALQRMANGLARDPELVRAVEGAVQGALRQHLPSAIERILRADYGGAAFRVYVPARGSRADKALRDQRIRDMAGPPQRLSAEAIAAREGISVRRVWAILADAANGQG